MKSSANELMEVDEKVATERIKNHDQQKMIDLKIWFGVEGNLNINVGWFSI